MFLSYFTNYGFFQLSLNTHLRYLSIHFVLEMLIKKVYGSDDESSSVFSYVEIRNS